MFAVHVVLRHQTWRRKLAFGLSVILAALLLAGYAPAAAHPTSPAASWHTLRVNLNAVPYTLDPQLAEITSEISHLQLIYESLTRLDENLEPAFGAAESWVFNGDGSQLTFTLRSGLQYSDGSPLNAKRFEYAILRALNPVLVSGYGPILDDISGAYEYRTAEIGSITPAQLAALKAAVGVHALDGSDVPCTSYAQADCLKLRLHFTHPTPYFPVIASNWVIYPVKEEIITAGGVNWWQSASFHIGNGAFVLSGLNLPNSASFSPNPYYGRGLAAYNIAFSYNTNTAAALQSYQNYALDVITPGIAEYAIIQGNPLLQSQLVTTPGSCTMAVMFNDKAPFTDIKVREAFTRAIDRQALVDQVLGGMGLPTLSWIPYGYPGYDPADVRQSYNPAAAVQALNDSTYSGAGGLPPIEVAYVDSPRNFARWSFLVSQWSTVLGINVTLNPVDQATFNQLSQNKATAPLMYIMGWCADYPDPQNWLSVYWHTGATAGRIYYSNPAVDDLLDLADSTLDPALRLQRYLEAQHLILEDTPAAFLWNSLNAFLIKPWVKGFLPTPQDIAFPGIMEPLSIYFDTLDVFIPLVKR